MYIVAQRTMMMIEPRCSPTEAQKLPKNEYRRTLTQERTQKTETKSQK